ncbi:otogelin-like [Pitangus sulphuratus]|nr:otogelin-like [Pitangus sulphuratus]
MQESGMAIYNPSSTTVSLFRNRRPHSLKCGPSNSLTCFNGGECVYRELCNCSRFNATGPRCQTVYNTGAERDHICRTWGQYNFETFDGLYYYFSGKSTYVLVRHAEVDEQSFSIQVNNDPECHSSPYSCKRSISLFFSGDEQIKMSSGVTYKGFGVQLPYIIGNLHIQKLAGYFLVRHQYAFTLAWDGISAVYIKMAPEYLGKTHGLCGNNNAILQDDLETSYGLIYENELCVKPMDCPCDYHGSFFEMGSVVYEECNNCTCIGGKWSCTNLTCPAECSVSGDTHFMTFDGRKYTFQATCQYILAKSRTSGAFTISLQNAPCGQNQDGSCIQSVSLILKQDPKRQVTLTHSGDVLIYDQYKINLPYADELFEIRKLSSVFLQVKTHIGLQILYDREGLRLYLQVDERWKDDTMGLCGTFNGNTEDDFLYE